MKVLFTLVALLATTQTFSASIIGAGWYSIYDQCFPAVELSYFNTNGAFGSLGLAVHNQEVCRSERFKVVGY